MSLFSNLFRKKSVDQALAAADVEHSEDGVGLNKSLGLWDLTALGIAAIIGAGIFSTIGTASFNGGPGVVYLFIFTAVACGFAAFAYAEFASMLPVSGSAYTYSYVAFGELIAWIIGWALIMEYAVGNITVAVSWSGYFTGLCDSLGWHIPAWAQMDYVSAKRIYHDLPMDVVRDPGYDLKTLSKANQEGFLAWRQAPRLGGLRVILDLPAIIMSILITGLVYVGIRETRNAGNLMVILKMVVVLMVIAVGVFYVKAENWTPFLPHGFGGVMAGVSSVFFAYIGFDALSTTAEECKNPQRDLPRAMVYSIIICTVLYVIIALILTGMVKYDQLKVDDPLAFVFGEVGLKWFSGLVAVSAVVAMAGVFLVFQLGQPRIWMTMSRDGLLPRRFAHIHPKYKTPDFATIVTAIFVIVPMLFIPSEMVTDLCSMGTLFAFVLVCAGVLKLQVTPNAPRGKFRTPYINGQWIFPALLVGAVAFLMTQYKADTMNWVNNVPVQRSVEDAIKCMTTNELAALKPAVAAADSAGLGAAGGLVDVYLNNLGDAAFQRYQFPAKAQYEAGWALFQHKIPMWLFVLTCLALAVLAIRHKLSLIPMLGLVFCFYMMAQIPARSWTGFAIWLLIGLVIYFGYGYKHSRLAKQH
jgi:basic amino acid/polyamine antiporter, APA family